MFESEKYLCWAQELLIQVEREEKEERQKNGENEEKKGWSMRSDPDCKFVPNLYLDQMNQNTPLNNADIDVE